jgi:sec-independent protein translocase protein TatB
VLNLDPGKVLVVLLVALVVLGPDKLPRAARQAGAAWNQLRRWRARLENEVRGAFPDLPDTGRLHEAVRSPLQFLDRLADEHEAGGAAGGVGAAEQEAAAGGAAGAGGVAPVMGTAGPTSGPARGVQPPDVPPAGSPRPGLLRAGDPSLN